MCGFTSKTLKFLYIVTGWSWFGCFGYGGGVGEVSVFRSNNFSAQMTVPAQVHVKDAVPVPVLEKRTLQFWFSFRFLENSSDGSGFHFQLGSWHVSL